MASFKIMRHKPQWDSRDLSFITAPQLIRHILEHLAAGSESLPPGQSPSGAEPGSERPLGTEAFQGPAQPRGLSWKWGDSL